MDAGDFQDLNQLFEDVQLQAILPDGKTFPDCIPRFPMEDIARSYILEKTVPGFDLKSFVAKNFTMPAAYDAGFQSDVNRPIGEHIRMLWDFLRREPGHEEGSLINLPFPYIVPGGRFREIYYWDSYFTMLGLFEHGYIDMIENMVKNFAFLVQEFGHIPNGNRTYYLSRSQPPFFALMIELLAMARNDEAIYLKFAPELRAEYDYWQSGANDTETASLHTIKMPDGTVLTRYFDTHPSPRQESYAEDVHVSRNSTQPTEALFTHIRAGAESGWDFSSRWFADQVNINTIETTNIIPVDLNFLLHKMELILAKSAAIAGDQQAAELYGKAAESRLAAIIKYCWNENLGFFTDYNWATGKLVPLVTAAGLLPLFIASPENIFIKKNLDKIVENIKSHLLRPGGIVTTPVQSGQQWDAPNGWAPLQWMAVAGLHNFGETDLAAEIAHRWTALNRKVFKDTGKMMEKYDVCDINQLAGGGEYASQDGFGWTNGVYLAMQRFLNE